MVSIIGNVCQLKKIYFLFYFFIFFVLTGIFHITYLFAQTQNTGNLPFGDFTQKLVGSRITINFTANLQLNSLIQYDNETGIWGTNSRFRWIFHPLGDLFLVYNHNVMDIENRWVKDSNQFLIKFQYALRY